jgi:hypothetical protein
VDIEGNLLSYLDGSPTSDGRMADERYASFDYCFNYFQSFRDTRNVRQLASPQSMQLSCLHLGFYLASWGMYRGSAELLQKSARYLVPVVELIASTDRLILTSGETPWDIDLDCYTETNIDLLLLAAARIRDVRPAMSDTLITKIMLGVFRNVPAFDDNFRYGCKVARICATFGKKSLNEIREFYRRNAAVIDKYRVPSLDFVTGQQTGRAYTRAKVIDMAFFMEGLNRETYAGQKDRIERIATGMGKYVEFDSNVTSDLADMSVINFRVANAGNPFLATLCSGDLRISELAGKSDSWLRRLILSLAAR